MKLPSHPASRALLRGCMALALGPGGSGAEAQDKVKVGLILPSHDQIRWQNGDQPCFEAEPERLGMEFGTIASQMSETVRRLGRLNPHLVERGEVRQRHQPLPDEPAAGSEFCWTDMASFRIAAVERRLAAGQSRSAGASGLASPPRRPPVLYDVSDKALQPGGLLTLAPINFGWMQRFRRSDSRSPWFIRNSPCIREDAVVHVKQRGVRATGCDTVACDMAVIDGVGQETTGRTTQWLPDGILIIEWLTNLEKLSLRSLFVATPLKIGDGSGSPIRRLAFCAE